MSSGKRLVLDQDDFLDDDGATQSRGPGVGAEDGSPRIARTAAGTQHTIGVGSSSGAGAHVAASSSPSAAAAENVSKSRDQLAAIADAHRKSLVGMAGDGRGFTLDDLEQLTSVTLSKRHQFSEAEYEGGADPRVYDQLSQFQFSGTPTNGAAGAAAAAGTANAALAGATPSAPGQQQQQQQSMTSAPPKQQAG